MKTRSIIILSILLITTFCSLITGAAVPAAINYQGRLIDGTNLVSGQLSVVLRVFTNETSGSYLFEDSNNVAAVDGLYSTQLGAHPTFGNLTNALAGGEAWVEVEINGTALSPREQLVSVPYALDGNFVRKTGDTMTGVLGINVGARGDLVITNSGTIILIGRGAQNDEAGVAIGAGAAGRTNSLALGNQASASNEAAAVGNQARAGGYAVAVGRSANSESFGVALGYSAEGTDHSTALGYNTKAQDHSVAIGALACGMTTNYSVGIGGHAKSQSVAVGAWSYSEGNSIAVGSGAVASNGNQRIAIGSGVNTLVDDSAAIRGTLYLDGGTGVLYRSTFGSGAWTDLRSGLATGTPLYAFTEFDPIWNAQKGGYATGTPLYVEVDPIWTAEKSGYATTGALAGESVARIGADASLSNQLSVTSDQLATLQTGKVSKTGDTMTGALTIDVSVYSQLVVSSHGSGIQIGNGAWVGPGDGVAIGKNANGQAIGVAIGTGADGYNRGVGIGENADGSYESVAIGDNTWAEDEGSAIGYHANAFQHGVALGHSANGFEFGISIGVQSTNTNSGIGIGYRAKASHQGIAIGSRANAEGAYMGGSNRIAIGISVTNAVDESARVRGTLYLDGATGIFYRAAFGSGGWSNVLSFGPNGCVGIGTANPTNTLAVNGMIKAKEVVVSLDGWSDFVFAPGYPLMPLPELESFVQANGHLPGIPSAAQVAADGVNLGEMQARLLQKIEELTLHMIQMQKENERLKEKLASLEGRTL